MGEQLKQLTYAKYLQLDFTHDGNSPYVINKEGLDILDVGGGPVSLLLKTKADNKVVIDPCEFDRWVLDRYIANNIRYNKNDAESMKYTGKFDEVWLYNVLQHTEDPAKIFDNVYKALKKGGTFRFLDWVDTQVNVAHPTTLTAEQINQWVEKYEQPLIKVNINENNATGTIVYGVFTK